MPARERASYGTAMENVNVNGGKQTNEMAPWPNAERHVKLLAGPGPTLNVTYYLHTAVGMQREMRRPYGVPLPS